MPNVATRLLRNFRADQSWILKEGDMLYLPPRLPHQGTTVGEEACVTISMGFRAPDYKTLVTALWDHICQTRLQENNSLFADGAFAAQYLHSRGEVCVAARDEFKTGISSKVITVSYISIIMKLMKLMEIYLLIVSH